MKHRILSLILATAMCLCVFAFASCTQQPTEDSSEDTSTEEPDTSKMGQLKESLHSLVSTLDPVATALGISLDSLTSTQTQQKFSLTFTEMELMGKNYLNDGSFQIQIAEETNKSDSHSDITMQAFGEQLPLQIWKNSNSTLFSVEGVTNQPVQFTEKPSDGVASNLVQIASLSTFLDSIVDQLNDDCPLEENLSITEESDGETVFRLLMNQDSVDKVSDHLQELMDQLGLGNEQTTDETSSEKEISSAEFVLRVKEGVPFQLEISFFNDGNSIGCLSWSSVNAGSELTETLNISSEDAAILSASAQFTIGTEIVTCNLMVTGEFSETPVTADGKITMRVEDGKVLLSGNCDLTTTIQNVSVSIPVQLDGSLTATDQRLISDIQLSSAVSGILNMLADLSVDIQVQETQISIPENVISSAEWDSEAFETQLKETFPKIAGLLFGNLSSSQKEYVTIANDLSLTLDSSTNQATFVMNSVAWTDQSDAWEFTYSYYGNSFTVCIPYSTAEDGNPIILGIPSTVSKADGVQTISGDKDTSSFEISIHDNGEADLSITGIWNGTMADCQITFPDGSILSLELSQEGGNSYKLNQTVSVYSSDWLSNLT